MGELRYPQTPSDPPTANRPRLLSKHIEDAGKLEYFSGDSDAVIEADVDCGTDAEQRLDLRIPAGKHFAPLIFVH